MKKLIFICGLAILSSTVYAQNNKVKMDTMSYSVGVLIAQSLKQQGLDKVDASDLAQGVKDAIENGTLKVSLEEANEIVNAYMTEASKGQHEAIIAEGAKFLAENGKKDGIVTLPSGMQYKILKVGTGEKPGPTDKVTTHYHGTLIDGTVFDSSVERGEPASFPVNGVIKGWQEALQLMPTGSKWRLFVPSDMAYGERGAGGAIKPYATLIFDVELLSIDK